MSDAEGVEGAGLHLPPDVPMEPFAVAYRGRSAFASASRPPLTTRYAPFLRSIRPYSAERLRTDVIAGVTVAALALPAAMAYAGIAGVPITVGLYGLLLPGAGERGVRHRAATLAPVTGLALWRAPGRCCAC